jgi:hypothetical protein
MSLVAYTITALQRDTADADASGKQVIVGATCSMFSQPSDVVVTLYDDAEGSNGSTAKTTGANGQVVVWVEQGRYRLSVNGNDSYISVGSDVPVDVDTFANLAASNPIQTGQRFICRERANAEYILQASGYVALTGDVTFANGRIGALQLDVGNAYVEWFSSPQDGVDRVKSEGGGTLYALGYYTLTETLVVDGGGVTVKGSHPTRVFDDIVSSSKGGVFYADFTSGPAILVSDGGCSIEGMVVNGSAARRAATITTGAQNTNAGLLIEGPDLSSDILQSVIIRDVKCSNHPADGILIEGDCTNIQVINCYTMDCGRHGKAMSSGDIGGRTNKKQCGIIMVTGGKSFDCGGHGFAVGHPSSAQFPYRITVDNHEGYRLALDAGQRYSTAANFVVAQDSDLRNCAFEGTTTGNVANHEGLEIGGRDTKITGCRYINCDGNYVLVRQQSGFSTENIEFDGGTAVTTGTVTDFAVIANGADGLKFLRISHDCTNPITDIAYNSNNNDIVLHDLIENLTVIGNHTFDFSNATVTGIKGSGLKVISSGVITIDRDGFYRVDTESAAASDTLVNINGGTISDVITIKQENSGRVVTIDDGGGNIRLAGSSDYPFPSSNTFVTLIFDGTNWQEISRSEN